MAVPPPDCHWPLWGGHSARWGCAHGTHAPMCSRMACALCGVEGRRRRRSPPPTRRGPHSPRTLSDTGESRSLGALRRMGWLSVPSCDEGRFGLQQHAQTMANCWPCPAHVGVDGLLRCGQWRWLWLCAAVADDVWLRLQRCRCRCCAAPGAWSSLRARACMMLHDAACTHAPGTW